MTDDTTPPTEVVRWIGPDLPLEVRAPKSQRVLEELRARPGDWALVAETAGLTLFPWWGNLRGVPGVRVRIAPKDPAVPLGGSLVYARYDEPTTTP